MMKITEVARLLGKPEKTIRYWIRHEKLPARLVNGQYEIDASDLPVIPEESPGIDSLITRIEGLERKLEDAQEYAFSSHSDYAHVSGLLYTLEQRLEALEREVKASHERLESHTPAQPKILRPSVPEYRISPGGLVTATSFAKRHQVTKDRMAGLIEDHAFETTKVPYGHTEQHQLNADQQRDVLLYWQQSHIPFGQCRW